MQTKVEPICKNCLLYNREKNECKVAILISGKKFHLPVSPDDKCHFDEMKIPVEQVRWWVEDPETGQPAEKGIVKMEYPENLFKKIDILGDK